MTLQYIPPKMIKIWQTWTYTLFEVVFTQVTASLTNWYLRRFFKILLYIFLYWKKIDLHCCLNLFKKIFNNFCLYISMNKFDSPPPAPIRGPTLPPGIIIWTNLNLHYPRKLPPKLQLFWAIGGFFINIPYIYLFKELTPSTIVAPRYPR